MPKENYVPYHMHTEYSLLDSCDSPQDYIDLAVKNGMEAIAFTEHGNVYNWPLKLMLCEKAGIKYIHGCEVYLTEQLEPKIDDNYHTVLLAKNMDGVRELNALVSIASHEDHKFYQPRISFDEFLNMSDNIISTSACVGGPLRKLPRDHPRYMELVNKFDFLEIQAGNFPEQIEYNKRLYELSQQTGKPLIAATDTHYSDDYKKSCRRVLMYSKGFGSKYDNDSLDLSFKSREELENAFKVQSSLPESVYIQAIDNTNLLIDLTEKIEVDRSIKYPISYGSPEKDAEMLREICRDKLIDKVKRKVIPKSQFEAFGKAIKEELDTFEKLGMGGFMLSMAELMSFVRDSGMGTGFARGSVAGSRVAYVTDIIDVNPEKWGTIFSRFCNEDRVEVGDIDIDVAGADRPAIIKYLADKFGEDKIASVPTFSTLQEKECILTIGRGLKNIWDQEYGPDSGNPWTVSNVREVLRNYEASPERAEKLYPELMQYFNGLIGTKVARGIHAGGVIVSPISLQDNYGTVWDKDEQKVVFTLDMDVCHDLQLVKYDILGLKTITVCKEAFDMAGLPFPKSHEVNWDDKDVWDDILTSPYGIFQFEGDHSFKLLKKFNAHSIFDMTLMNAAIRPSAKSYQNELSSRIIHKNPSPIIDELLKDNLGYLVYQEDIIAFLQQICGLTGSQADTVRRGIAKKQRWVLDEMMPTILDGYCSKSDKPREIAEREVQEFIKIIEDSSSYMFGKNHAIAYCMLGYITGWLRYYYPCEFITAFLNNATQDDDIANGAKLAAQKGIKITKPKWGHSKAKYFFNKEERTITKGLQSIKTISGSVADGLYDMSQSKDYKRFSDVLMDCREKKLINTGQMDTLIRLDFFDEFGNQREILRIHDTFVNIFKSGSIERVKRSSVEGTFLEPIIEAHGDGLKKSGEPAASFKILDFVAIMHEAEDAILANGLTDLSPVEKAINFNSLSGYPGYISYNNEDRPLLYVLNVRPARKKITREIFGYNITTRSIGSGKESVMTVYASTYKKEPLKKDDIIYIPPGGWYKNNEYYNISRYKKMN